MMFFPSTARSVYERSLLPASATVDGNSKSNSPSAASPVGSPLIADPLAAPSVPRRILVVDDDPGIRDVIAEVLRGARYRVQCAEDGEVAWNALRTQYFHLLITDHEMPRLSGMDLLRRVRTDAGTLPVILISGKIPWSEPDLPRLLPPGVALEKPFSFIDLLAKVRRFLTPIEHQGGFHNGSMMPGLDRIQMPRLDAPLAG